MAKKPVKISLADPDYIAKLKKAMPRCVICSGEFSRIDKEDHCGKRKCKDLRLFKEVALDIRRNLMRADFPFTYSPMQKIGHKIWTFGIRCKGRTKFWIDGQVLYEENEVWIWSEVNELFPAVSQASWYRANPKNPVKISLADPDYIAKLKKAIKDKFEEWAQAAVRTLHRLRKQVKEVPEEIIT